MGSRIMHAIIGYKIAESFAIEDKTSFLLGSIAPDAVTSKELSHFFKGEVADYSRHIDYRGFLEKYRLHVDRDYILGYCTHLIADDMWLKGFYLPWLKNRMNADEGLHEKYHQDFRLLNGKLLEYYNFTDDLKNTLSHFPVIEDLDEVKFINVEKFVPYVFSDMEYDKEDIDARLHVFTFEQIVGYIETSVDLGLLYIKSLGQGVENMVHTMGLYEEPFNSIKNGRKTVEVRLNNEKRRKIKIGDNINFIRVPEENESLSVKVIGLRQYPTFKEMYEDIPFKDFDCDGWTMKDMVEETYEVYTPEQEESWGTLAITIELMEEV